MKQGPANDYAELLIPPHWEQALRCENSSGQNQAQRSVRCLAGLATSSHLACDREKRPITAPPLHLSSLKKPGEHSPDIPFTILQYLPVKDLLEDLSDKISFRQSKLRATLDEVLPIFLPYMQQLQEALDAYDGESFEVKGLHFVPGADLKAHDFEPDSFQVFLDAIPGQLLENYPEFLIPFARYAVDSNIQKLIQFMTQWEGQAIGNPHARLLLLVAQEAILFSDSQAAWKYVLDHDLTVGYNQLRQLDPYLASDIHLDFLGLNESGLKYFDLGTTLLETGMNKDLTLYLRNRKTQTEVASFFLTGVDPDIAAAAKADFDKLQAGLQYLLDNQLKRLRDALLDGNLYRSGFSWKYAYLNHPVLNRLARLFVWRYSDPFVKHTFTLTEKGPIKSDGSAYEIGDYGSIRMAHPVEMGRGEVERWRYFFADNHIQQPFDQVSIPVTRISGEDLESRYAGIELPRSAIDSLLDQGFHLVDKDPKAYWQELSIGFGQAFTLEVEAANKQTVKWQAIDEDEVLSLGKAYVWTRSRRTLNHIALALDDATLLGKIDADDLDIASRLQIFSEDQINRFWSYAVKHRKTACAAVILAHKEERFSKIDLDDEYRLDDI